MAHTLTTCTFCGVGCGIYLETSGDRVVGAYPSMSHPTNEGRICARGWHVHEIASSPDRLTTPLLRKNGNLCEATWDEAIEFVASRLAGIRAEHGPDALAFLCSPRCSNEEAYLLQKLARAVVGTNNVDHGAGVYTNNSLNTLLAMTGVPAATNSVGELSACDVIIVDGVDLGRQLPTIGGRVLRAKLDGARLIVVDSRRHRLVENADLFLQVKPATEARLYGAMAKVIVDRGLMDLPFIRARCRDYPAFLASLSAYDLLSAAGACGVAPEAIEAAAVMYAGAAKASILYSTGIEARGEGTTEALVDLALLTGHLGKEGCGIYALAEQNNLQGVCDMGMLPNLLPGYRPVEDAVARAEQAAEWGTEPPPAPGRSARSVFSPEGGTGVRALWMCRYDPIGTAFCGHAVEALDRCDLVVVQHLFMTDTAQHADVVLPTTAYGEERVTFTSTDRRIQVAEQVVQPRPGPLPAWQHLQRVAQAMGAPWHYERTEDVMDEIARVVPFYGGVTYDNLARDYGRQWPCTQDRPLGTRFLFADGGPPQPFRFAALAQPSPEAAAADGYPFALVFSHSLYYWHRNVLVSHSETLKREYGILLLDYPDWFAEINDEDARELGIRDGQKVRLCSPTGTAGVAARVTGEVRRGTVFVPFFVAQVRERIQGCSNGAPWVPVRVEKEAA